jgi:hypothetical protein
MEYIVNTAEENYDIILFEYDNRRWEIMIDVDLSEIKIQSLIQIRIDSLIDEYNEFGHYDNSDLIKDYTIKQ